MESPEFLWGWGRLVRDDIAGAVLSALGGRGNVLANTVCMTRLRVTVANVQAVDFERLNDIPSVLGTATRGANGLEVVFGPRVIDGIYHAFIRLTGIHPSTAALFPMSRQNTNMSVQINARRTDEEEEDEGLELLDVLLEAEPATPIDRAKKDESWRLLVLNGPNVNMLGIVAEDMAAGRDFATLLETCKESAREAGFEQCVCYQSNHLGDLIDQIQDAYCIFDAIVLNPSSYASSRVLIDALNIVEVPFELVILDESAPEGFEAYRKAISNLALRLAREAEQTG